MATELDFSVVANNSVSLEIPIFDQNDDPVDGTGYALKWTWFIPGRNVNKSTAGGTILIKTANPLVIQIPILASDTLGGNEGYYPHEAITVDGSGLPVTVTNNDARLSWGTGFLRRQLTVQ